jgi:sugar phosphate isomerase/epimerase
MRIVVFSKFFRDLDAHGLAEVGASIGCEGWDLAVRKGYPVNPDNALTELPRAARALADAGQPVCSVTGDFDVLLPESPNAEPLLRAMDAADVRLLKLGYFLLEPGDDYWDEVDRVRAALVGWQTLGRTYGVKIVYHTHSGGSYLGTNASALMHLLRDLDPSHIGAYLDPGHLRVNGEAFPFAVAMAGRYLSMVALKDCRPRWRPDVDEGRVEWDWVLAGQGGVEWGTVFSTLTRAGFVGPCSVHAEFEVPRHAPGLFLEMVRADVAYFRAKRDAARAVAPA